MKHFLAAVDINEVSDQVFERALQLAQQHDAELTVLHVIDDAILNYDDDSSLESRLIDNTQAKLSARIATLSKEKTQRVRPLVKVGRPWEDILLEANKRKVDLIILGVHRTNTLKDIFIGTTAERIIRNSTIPVLVVKDKPAGPYATVVAATDFSPCSAHALGVGLNLAPDATFYLLHVFETPFPSFIRLSADELADYKRPFIEQSEGQAREAMDAYLKGHGASKASVTCLLEHGEPASGIARVVARKNSDLLVMGTHGHTGFAGSMIGSYSIDFLNAPPCDILVSR